MNVEEYLDTLFSNINPYELSEEEARRASRDKAGYILGKLARKSYRRKLTDKTRNNLGNKIDYFIRNNKPIHFTIPFGGYKHFWNPSHPQVDWAELFNFRFLTDYVLPILAVHKSGVVIEYLSEDLIINKMNNYPPERLEEYTKSFREILSWYCQFLPENLEIKYTRISDLFDKRKMIAETEKLIPLKYADYEKLSEVDKKAETHRSQRSIMWDGDESLEELSDDEKQSRILKSRMVELAYYDVEDSSDFLDGYLWKEDNIMIWFSGGLSTDNIFEDLTLASSPGSCVDFWIGRGIVTINNDKFRNTIFSKNQYNEVKNSLRKVNLPRYSMLGENFISIEVLENKNFCLG